MMDEQLAMDNQVQELFALMKRCSLCFEDMESAYFDMDEPVEFAFWIMALHAYYQASFDPHIRGDAPGMIVDKILSLPILDQEFGYEVGLAYSQSYADIFIQVYESKWGQKPDTAIVKRELDQFQSVFLSWKAGDVRTFPR